MIIKKIIQESSIDYPGKYGPVIFTAGCNFRCGFCHNPELINFDNGEENLDSLNDLKPKIDRGWYDGVCITGGEPLLHRSIDRIINLFKDMGLAVKIDTNGSNPEFLEELIKRKAIDYVAMDVKGPKEIYNEITNVKVNLENIEKSMKILAFSEIDFEFRTTIIPIINKEIRWFNEKEINEMLNWVLKIIEGNKRKIKWNLQKFIARNKGEILSEDYSKEKLPKEFWETPEEIMQKIKNILEKYFEVEIIN